VKLDWKAGLGIAISAGLLWWLFRDLDVAEFMAQVRQANPWLFLASVLVATSAYLIRTVRWGVLLDPVAPHTSFANRWATIMIGFMANNVLPARIGEIVRAYALNRVEPVPVSAAFGTLVMARLLDGVGVLLLLMVALALPNFPAEATVLGTPVLVFARGIAIVLAGALAVLFALLIWPQHTVGFSEAVATRVLPSRAAQWVVAALESFLQGIAAVRSPVLFAKALALSVVHWAYYGLSFWLALAAFGIDVGYGGALFVQAMVAVGVALPSAPGFVGTWHAAARVALVGAYSVSEPQALAFATSFHLAGFIPITLLGFYYAWKLGISLDTGRNEPAAPDLATPAA